MTAAIVEFVAQTIRANRFLFASEDQLQGALDQVLTGAGLHVDREVALSRGDRVDLLVDGRIGVEVKVGGSPVAVARQLQRYAHHDRIEHLVLVTAVATHASLPEEIGGKSLTVVSLLMAAL